MITVLIGMSALAIDGSRGYALRRDLQAALDSAALAAADKLQQTGSYSSAEQAASTIFGTNLHLYSAPSCSPGYGSPGAAPFTVTCTYSDGSVLTEVVAALGPQGSQFTMSGTRALQVQFARVLTSGASLRIAGSASGGVSNLLYAPSVGALNQAGCGGTGGAAVTLSGSGTLNVNGDVVSDGAISLASGSLRVAGDIYARCQSTVPGAVANACYPSGASAPCTYPDVAGATRSGFRLTDPNYSVPVASGGSQARPGFDVVLSPGTYAADPAIALGDCYFLSPGVYQWQAGFSNNGGFVSNELKPPDEPVAGNNSQTANPQFWNTNGVNCAGAFQFTASGSFGLPMGTWGLELTSVRTDSYSGNTYVRESAPSRCRSIPVFTLQTITLSISNVPGAQSYNIYVSANGCAGPFGLAGPLPVSGPVQNRNTKGCPFGTPGTCTLGTETLSVPALVLPSLPIANLFAPPGTGGAYPPSGETAPLQPGLPNQNPDRTAPPAGDRANENQCNTIFGAPATCPGPITPGAVEMYMPNGSCLNANPVGDNYIFSGYQYNWLSVYEPGAANPPLNNCSNTMGAAGNSAFVGLVYTPAAILTVSSGAAFDSEATGGLLANRVIFTGALPTIVYSKDFAPVPPASRLVS